MRGDDGLGSNGCRANVGSGRSVVMPRRLRTICAGFERARRLAAGASGPARRRACTGRSASSFARRDIFPASHIFACHADFSFAMSTEAGHSALHALHEMQRSITSAIAGPVSSSGGSFPERTRRSALARARVESRSSSVTM